MTNLIMNAPDYYLFTFKVRTIKWETHYIKVVSNTRENAFTELFRYLRRGGLQNSPVTKIVDVEPYIIE